MRLDLITRIIRFVAVTTTLLYRYHASGITSAISNFYFTLTNLYVTRFIVQLS